MKICIWCRKSEGENSFDKDSHILPQSLGCIEICRDVCDPCNEYFGQKTSQNKKIPIDIALKEILVLSKYLRLNTFVSYQKFIGKEATTQTFGQFIEQNEIQKLNRNTEFFNIESISDRRTVNPTRTFKLQCENPKLLTNQLNRGLFKVAFETAYNAHSLNMSFKPFTDPYYDYIRHFVRYGRGNLRLFYLRRRVGVEFTCVEWITEPRVEIINTENCYLLFEILGHRFAASIGLSNFTEYNFLNSYKTDPIFKPVRIRSFLDIDLFDRVFKK